MTFDGLPPPGNRTAYLRDLLLERLPVRLVKARAKGLRLEGGVALKSPGRLRLGRGVVLQRNALLHAGGKPWCGYGGGIRLDDEVVVGPGAVLYGAGGLHIGAGTHLGPGVILTTQGGDDRSRTDLLSSPLSFGKVVLGRGCWIGAGAVLVGETVLGDGCTVGPNSVVKGSYGDGTVLIGNPARVTRRKAAVE